MITKTAIGQPRIGNAELISSLNRTLVLQAIRRLQPTFRAEVSRSTNLNPATVTAIVGDLLKGKLVKEIPGDTKSASPAGGRPPLMLELNDKARRVLAIDLEPDVLRVALVGLNITLIEYREQAINRHGSPDDVIEAIATLYAEVLRSQPRKRVDGIALSLPGLIDRDRGILISSTNMPKWHNVPIRDLIEARLGMKPKLDRACHLAAMYEDWIDRSRSNYTKIVFTLRTGIGMSLVRRGELYLGAGGFDGEVGHTVIDLNGPICECGNKGCLETFVRADAICARVETMLRAGRCGGIANELKRGKTLRPEIVYELAMNGDADSTEIVQDVGRYIGLAAANVINLLSPDEFILCGSIDTAGDLVLRSIRREIEEHALFRFRQHLTVRLGVGKGKSPLLGAAVLAVRELFDLPRLLRPQFAPSN